MITRTITSIKGNLIQKEDIATKYIFDALCQFVLCLLIIVCMKNIIMLRMGEITTTHLIYCV